MQTFPIADQLRTSKFDKGLVSEWKLNEPTLFSTAEVEVDTVRILIVEDEPFIALDLEAAVENAAHEVAGIADTKQSALALARSSGCDAALVDLRLKDGFTGPDVAAALRLSGIAFAFVTGNPEQLPDDGLGAVEIIGKPFTHAQIRNVLRRLLGEPMS